MNDNVQDPIAQQYLAYLAEQPFPCVAAKAALQRGQVKTLVVDNMASPAQDVEILDFLYGFVDDYRASTEFFHSAAVIFRGPGIGCEGMFDALLWQRLQALADQDALHHDYDARVDADPDSAKFSFSLKGEAFFIIGLHPKSNRPARQFSYPMLTFNPHAQFETLREKNRYDAMKKVIRQRDVAYAGSVNPMLDDFGDSSEVFQYSGRQYGSDWRCPLKIGHANASHLAA